MHVTIEHETKLEADRDFTLPDLRHVVPRTSVLPAQRLWSTYFDTIDLRLWALGLTLRHRSGDDDGPGTWTLKLPVEGDDRQANRAEHTWVGAPDDLPAEAEALLLGVARREPLRVVAELECTRRRVALEDETGERMAEIDDDTVTVHGGREDGLTFHEVELETASEDRRLETVLQRLVEAGARPGDNTPKVGRALGRPSGGGAAGSGPDATVERLVRHGISTSLHRLVDHEYRLRVSPSDPPSRAIHQARVAARRLRSDLKTLGPLLDPIWLRHTRDDLRWLGSALGEVRDCDVLAAEFGDKAYRDRIDPEGRAILMAALLKERASACREVGRVIGSDRYLNLLDRLHAAASRPPLADPSVSDAPAADIVAPLVAHEWRKLRNTVSRAGRRSTDHQLHRIRIHSKQVRYAAELLSPVMGPRAGATARSAKDLQTTLGHHQDAVVAEAWLRHQADVGPGIVGFAAGQLAMVQRERREVARAGWRRRWRRLDRAKRLRWMGARA